MSFFIDSAQKRIIIEKGKKNSLYIPKFAKELSISDEWIGYNEEMSNQLKNRLSEIAKWFPTEYDPSYIWGIENLANLSLELEDNELANMLSYRRRAENNSPYRAL